MEASWKGHKEVVQSLLSAGADINLPKKVCDNYDCYDESCFLYLLFVNFKLYC